jgi:hypothetical protein
MKKSIVVLVSLMFSLSNALAQIIDFKPVKFGIEVFGTSGSYLVKQTNYDASLWKPGAGFGLNLWILPKKRVNIFLQAGYEYQQGAFSYNPEDVLKKQTDSLKAAYIANPTVNPTVPEKINVLEKSQFVFFHPAVRLNLVNKIFKFYVMAGAKLNYTLGVTTDYDVKQNELKTKANLNTSDFTVDPSARFGFTFIKTIDLSFSYTQKINTSNTSRPIDKALLGTHLAIYF